MQQTSNYERVQVSLEFAPEALAGRQTNVAGQPGGGGVLRRTYGFGNLDCAQSAAARRFQLGVNSCRISTRRNSRSCDVNWTTNSVGHDPQREGAPVHVGKGYRLDGWQRGIHTERNQLWPTDKIRFDRLGRGAGVSVVHHVHHEGESRGPDTDETSNMRTIFTAR